MTKYAWDIQNGEYEIYLGTVKLNGATPVTVSNVPLKTTGATIVFGLNTVGGTVGAYPVIQTITPSTSGGTTGPQGAPPPNGSFTVQGTAGDTSTYNVRIWN